MARIEWTRLSGEDVEHVVAVLLCRHNPSALMVRPSQGDGGLDVIVPIAEGLHDVYQVKKFASNLTSSQWRQITRSCTTLLSTIDDGEIAVRNWYLTMPLDPTRRDLERLKDLTAEAPFSAEWRGLTFIEGLAATYPEVIDYYLRDGKERLQSAVSDMSTLIRGVDQPPEGTGAVDPQTIWPVLAATQRLLDTDPHFTYAVSLSPVEPAEGDDGAVVASHKYDPALGQWISVKVFERFAQALRERPITFQVDFRAEPGTPLRKDLERFQMFGRPFSAPTGTVDVKADLPGGLGGTIKDGALTIRSARGATKPHRLRFAVTDADEQVLAQIRITLTDQARSPDDQGLWATGTDEGRSIRYESTVRIDERSMDVRFRPVPVGGKPPEEVVEGLRFLSLLPNAAGIAVAPPYGPIRKSMIEPWRERAFSGDKVAAEEFKTLADLAHALTVIQQHTSSQLLMPDAEKMLMSEARELIRIARLLEGPPIRDTLPRRVTFDGDPNFPTTAFQVFSHDELTLTWDGEESPLGTIYTYSPAVIATLHDDQPEAGCAYTLAPITGSEWLETTNATFLPVALVAPQPASHTAERGDVPRGKTGT